MPRMPRARPAGGGARLGRVRVRGRRVTVAVRPRVPLVSRLLRSRVSAHAGPEPAP